MATKAGATITDLNYGVVESSRDAKLLVFGGVSSNLAGYEDSIAAIVRQAGAQNVKRVVL